MNKSLEALIDEAKQSASIMEYIASFEPQEIDGDDVELRFEIDNVDTGTDISLVEQCGKASSALTALIAALEQAQQREQEWKSICEAAAIDLDEWTELDKKSGDLICKLADAFIKQGERIAELELSCDRNYINGMKTGWNYCDAGNSEGFEKCIEQRRKAMESLCVNPDVTMRGVEPLCVKLQPELWEITIPGELAHSHAYHSPENGDYSPDQVVERFYSESQLRAAGVTVGGE